MRMFFLEEWFRTYNNLVVRSSFGIEHHDASRWSQQFEVSRNQTIPYKGFIRVRISQKRLYKLYLSFIREFFPQSRARNFDTFKDELVDVGVIIFPKRRDIKTPTGKRKFFVVDIYFHLFKAKMLKLYSGITINTWLHEENLKEFLKEFAFYRDTNFMT